MVGASKVSLAVELLEFEEEVAPAMHHIFGTTLVCTDKQSARTVCEKLSLKTVTLEGDLYDPSGSLSGGSRPTGGASVLCQLAELSELRQQLAAYEHDLGELAAKLEDCRKQSERYQQLHSELELKQQQLDLHNQAARSSQSGQLAAALERLQQQLSEQQLAAECAKSSLVETTKQHDALAKQLKDFEGNREERMAQSKAAIAKAESAAKAAAKAMQTAQQAEQKLSLQQQELQNELDVSAAQLEELDRRQEQQAAAVEEKAAGVHAKKEEYDAAVAALQARKDALGGYDAEASKLAEQREQVEKSRADAELELKQIEHRQKRAQADIDAAEGTCEDLLRRNPWMEAEKADFGKAGTAYDFKKTNPAVAAQTLAKKTAELESLSKRINKKVLSMFETAEQASPRPGGAPTSNARPPASPCRPPALPPSLPCPETASRPASPRRSTRA